VEDPLNETVIVQTKSAFEEDEVKETTPSIKLEASEQL
jgi:hypothetical protein